MTRQMPAFILLFMDNRHLFGCLPKKKRQQQQPGHVASLSYFFGRWRLSHKKKIIMNAIVFLTMIKQSFQDKCHWLLPQRETSSTVMINSNDKKTLLERLRESTVILLKFLYAYIFLKLFLSYMFDWDKRKKRTFTQTTIPVISTMSVNPYRLHLNSVNDPLDIESGYQNMLDLYTHNIHVQNGFPALPEYTLQQYERNADKIRYYWNDSNMYNRSLKTKRARR
jgi:hypothetical protein